MHLVRLGWCSGAVEAACRSVWVSRTGGAPPCCDAWSVPAAQPPGGAGGVRGGVQAQGVKAARHLQQLKQGAGQAMGQPGSAREGSRCVAAGGALRWGRDATCTCAAGTTQAPFVTLCTPPSANQLHPSEASGRGWAVGVATARGTWPVPAPLQATLEADAAGVAVPHTPHMAVRLAPPATYATPRRPGPSAWPCVHGRRQVRCGGSCV